MGLHLLDRAVVQSLFMLMTVCPGLLLADGVALTVGVWMFGDLGQLGLVQAVLVLVLNGPGDEFGIRRAGVPMGRGGHGWDGEETKGKMFSLRSFWNVQ